jgi:hypothetical protein
MDGIEWEIDEERIVFVALDEGHGFPGESFRETFFFFYELYAALDQAVVQLAASRKIRVNSAEKAKKSSKARFIAPPWVAAFRQ